MIVFSFSHIATGQVFSFGWNYNGQLGDGTTANKKNRAVAVDTSGVLNGKTITAIAAGDKHSLVLSCEKAFCSNEGYLFSLNFLSHTQQLDKCLVLEVTTMANLEIAPPRTDCFQLQSIHQEF